MFGKSKSARTVPTEGADALGGDVKIVKSKSFKRIRGLLRGESRKERRARKDAEKAESKDGESAPAQAEEDDEFSAYRGGVEVDERSVVTSGMPNIATAGFLQPDGLLSDNKIDDSKKAYILKVVLLLMDPETRRFELLQLEFDSLKALVSDVLAQIPVSVTEEALRLQSYTGIAGKDGIEMVPSQLLATFCKGNEVLVAIPDGVPAKECSRLARPILSDDKVVTMLASSGIDASGWKEDLKKKKKKSAFKSTDRSAPSSTVAEPLEATKKGGKVFTVVFIALIALLLQVFHVYISAPVNMGSTISPGLWLSKCGLLTLLPSCENAYLHFDRNGVVTHYNAAKVETWKMDGAVCDAEDEACVPGMQIQDDGKIVIGGKHVYYVTSFVKDASLSPWPFAETPKVKIWRK